MWTAMMVPSLVPMLWCYRVAVAKNGEFGLGVLTVLAGVGYFLVWATLGIVVLLMSLGLPKVDLNSMFWAHTTPIVVGLVVAAAGGVQFTRWKQRQLAYCHGPFDGALHLKNDIGDVLRQCLLLGLQCIRASGNLMAILLVLGFMDLYTMAAISTAITAERLAPGRWRVWQTTGTIIVVMGVAMLITPKKWTEIRLLGFVCV